MWGKSSRDCYSEVVGWVGWARLWDVVLVSGGKAVRGMQMLSRIMKRRSTMSKAALQCSVLDHILDHHGEELFLEPAFDANKLLTLLEQLHLDFLAKFRNFVCLGLLCKHTHVGFIN